MKRCHLFCVIILTGFHSFCCSQESDSCLSVNSHPRFNPVSTLVLPSAFITYGVLCLDDNGLYSSQDAYHDMREASRGFHTHADDYFQFIPVLAVYGLNLAGIKGKHDFLDRTAIYLTGLSLAGITTHALKNGTHRIRPDSSNYRSFPSGHTAVAFASATFLFREYRDASIWYGIAGYSMATATGILRMLNNKHWMSDVFVGAGLGILFTEMTYYIYPVFKDFVSKRISQRENSLLSFTPYCGQKNIGIHLRLMF